MLRDGLFTAKTTIFFVYNATDMVNLAIRSK